MADYPSWLEWALVPVLVLIFLGTAGCQSPSAPASDPTALPLQDQELPISTPPASTPSPTREAIFLERHPAPEESPLPPLYTAVVELKSITADDAIGILTPVFPAVGLTKGPAPGILLVRGQPENVRQAQALLSKLDRPAKQISIESQIIEVADSGLKELGLAWGATPGAFRFSYDGATRRVNADNLQTTLSLLISQGRARTLARPRITTTDNQEAVINIGSRIPYAVPSTSAGSTTIYWTIQYIDAGVKLRITPRLGAEGWITAKIAPEVSAISEWRTTPAGEFPVIATRNADTILQVKNGEMIAIGGLINETERENFSKLAVLGDLPLLGALFQKRTTEKAQTDVVFLIRPVVL